MLGLIYSFELKYTIFFSALSELGSKIQKNFEPELFQSLRNSGGKSKFKLSFKKELREHFAAYCGLKI